MKTTMTFRADGRVDEVRRPDGSLFWSFDGGLAPAPQPRCDSTAWLLPEQETAFRADAEDTEEKPMTKITSSAQLKAALGIREAPPPRRREGGTLYPSVMRHDAQVAAANAAAGFVTSSADLRARLGLPGPFKPRQLPYDQTVRHDSAAPQGSLTGPIRSSADLRLRLRMFSQ